MRTLDLTPLFRSSVGFDRFDKLFDAAYREASRESSYPPYNIAKLGENDYQITMAVAGFAEDELDLEVRDNLLVVTGRAAASDEKVEYLHRGIAKRAFEHKFQLADHVRVVGAKLENGLLDITLAREIPEAMKPRKIAIGSGTTDKVRTIDTAAA